ncbi:hypothetical protein VTL71DRAFT_11873 [Oculimacula yallundae]|uniref:Uncharacterized protein n=1 Tax=Oculimacula yallundae TaxID=86028 RepID=A0ABR4CRF5_9HELO
MGVIPYPPESPYHSSPTGSHVPTASPEPPGSHHPTAHVPLKGLEQGILSRKRSVDVDVDVDVDVSVALTL